MLALFQRRLIALMRSVQEVWLSLAPPRSSTPNSGTTLSSMLAGPPSSSSARWLAIGSGKFKQPRTAQHGLAVGRLGSLATRLLHRRLHLLAGLGSRHVQLPPVTRKITRKRRGLCAVIMEVTLCLARARLRWQEGAAVTAAACSWLASSGSSTACAGPFTVGKVFLDQDVGWRKF